MHRASLVLGALLTVAFVTAPGIAGSARAQGSQDPGNPAYGQQQGNDQNEASPNSDDSRQENPGAQPDQGDSSSGSSDPDQNNNEGNDSDSTEQENQ